MKNLLPKIFLCCAFVIVVSIARGQQMPVNNQYQVNPYSLSPSFAGYNFKSQAFIGYRKQWTGMPASPQTSFASVVLPAWERVWLGARIVSDKTNIFNNFQGSLSYTYQLPVAIGHFFRFSLWGSIFQNNINLQNINISDANDPILEGKTKLVGTAFNAGAGVLYQNQRLVTGLSVPTLFVSKETYSVDGNKNLLVMERQFIAFGYYKFKLNKNWNLKAGLVYRATKNSPSIYDIFSEVKYKNIVWGNLLYRRGTIIGIGVGGYILNDFTLNYTFEFINNGFTSYTSGTHEITIGFDLNIGKRSRGGDFEHYPLIMKYNKKYRR